MAILKPEQLSSGSYSISGSFSGSFFGDGSNLTNLPVSQIDTGSFVTTSSFNAFTGSYNTGSFSGSFEGTSSYALTASYLEGGITIDTGSFVTTSSFNAFTGSYNTGSFTGSFTGDGSGLTGIVSASYAETASYAVSASYEINYETSSSYADTASLAEFALTASYVQNAQTASYVLNAVSSSFANTASYATNALSASFASTVPASGVIGLNLSQIATGSVTASVSPTQFTVTSGSVTELVVRGTGVTIGSATTDTHIITGSTTINSGQGNALRVLASNSDFRLNTGLSNLTPTLAVINTSGKAAGLVAGTQGSAFAYDNSGFFAIIGESYSSFTGNSIGGGTVYFRAETDGKISIGSSAAQARLDVRAQGALSTDIAFRVRNSADSFNLLSIDGVGLISGRTDGAGGFNMNYQGTANTTVQLTFNNGNPTLRVAQSTGGHAFNVYTSGDNREYLAGLIGKATFAIGANPLGGTIKPNEANTNTMYVFNGTAPTLSATDSFNLYSADRNGVAGKASPHFRTEDGTVVWLGDESRLFNVTASRTIISSSQNTISGSSLTVYGSGSAQPVFTVQGSQGELFSITDSLSGSLFSVNDISGLPILEVFSDNTTLIGDYQDPMLITTKKVVMTNSGSFTVYGLPTASYDTAFYDYSIRSGSNARAGQIMAIQSGSSVNFTETTTTDFGDTSAVAFTVIVSGSNMVLTGSSTTGSWTIKTIVRGL